LNGQQPYLFITNYTFSYFHSRGVSHAALLRLQDAGLLDSETFGGYGVEVSKGELVLNYFGQRIKFSRKHGRPERMLVPSVFMLTTSGRELYPVCGAEEEPGFLQYLVEFYKKDSHQNWFVEILPTESVT
jgi:hypothetical protein